MGSCWHWWKTTTLTIRQLQIMPKWRSFLCFWNYTISGRWCPEFYCEWVMKVCLPSTSLYWMTCIGILDRQKRPLTVVKHETYGGLCNTLVDKYTPSVMLYNVKLLVSCTDFPIDDKLLWCYIIRNRIWWLCQIPTSTTRWCGVQNVQRFNRVIQGK